MSSAAKACSPFSMLAERCRLLAAEVEEADAALLAVAPVVVVRRLAETAARPSSTWLNTVRSTSVSV